MSNRIDSRNKDKDNLENRLATLFTNIPIERKCNKLLNVLPGMVSMLPLVCSVCSFRQVLRSENAMGSECSQGTVCHQPSPAFVRKWWSLVLMSGQLEQNVPIFLPSNCGTVAFNFVYHFLGIQFFHWLMDFLYGQVSLVLVREMPLSRWTWNTKNGNRFRECIRF